MTILSLFRVSLVAGLLGMALLPVKAAVINAASGSFNDVSNAVAKANPGDTVVVPPGTNYWTTTLFISGISLQGAGVSNTVIMDETPIGSSTPMLQLSTTLTSLTRVSQIQFAQGITNNLTSNPNNYAGNIVVYGGSPNWRIDHCEFNLLTGKSIFVGDDSFGLIDHNIFLTYDRISVEIYGNGYGDADWAAPTQFGSANAVYMEDNYQSDSLNFGFVDVSGGGRCVFRHNTMVGSYFNTHGSETAMRYRSVRYVELYNNNFSYGGGQQYSDFFTMADIRGGSAVIFSNTATGYYSIADLEYFRATDNDSGFTPWFGATGQRAWDNNGLLPALTGTASVSSNVLVVAGANWTPNQWVGYSVYDPSNQLCGMVASSTANTMSFAGSRRAWLQITFNKGDTFVVHHIYPMLDQPGVGQCSLLSGDNPIPTLLGQAAEPIYVWNNSLNVMYNIPTPEPANAETVNPAIVQGRDYFNSARPNYTPYTYPHPLTATDANDVPVNTSTNSVTTTTNNVAPLVPPTNLSAHGL